MSIFDTPISQLPDPVDPVAGGWLFPIDDLNPITRKLNFDTLLSWVMQYVTNNFLPWVNGQSYKYHYEYVSYGGNTWRFVGVVPDNSTVPGTNSSVWELVSTGLGINNNTPGTRLIYSLPAAIKNDVNQLGLFYNKSFNWQPNLGTWGAVVGDKIVHRVSMTCKLTPTAGSFPGEVTEFSVFSNGLTGVATTACLNTQFDGVYIELEQVLTTQFIVTNTVRLWVYNQSGNGSNGRALDPTACKVRTDIADYNPTNIFTTITPFKTILTWAAEVPNSFELTSYDVMLIKGN